MCEVKYKVTFGFLTLDYRANFETCRDIWARECEGNRLDSQLEAMRWAVSTLEDFPNITFDVVTIISPVVTEKGHPHPYLEDPIHFDNLDGLKRALKDQM